MAATYTGNTTIKGNDARFGLRIGLNNALPTGTVLTIDTVNAGTGRPTWFDLNGFNQEVGGLTNTSAGQQSAIVNGNSLQDGILTVNNSGNYTYSAFLGPDNAHSNITSGSTGIPDGQGNNFSLVKTGAGTLTLSASNSYIGGTTVDGGTLVTAFHNDGNLINNGLVMVPSNVVTVNSGGTLTGTANNWAGNVAVPITGPRSHTYVINAGGLITNPSGSVTGLGNLTLNGGTLKVNNGWSPRVGTLRTCRRAT